MRLPVYRDSPQGLHLALLPKLQAELLLLWCRCVSWQLLLSRPRRRRRPSRWGTGGPAAAGATELSGPLKRAAGSSIAFAAAKLQRCMAFGFMRFHWAQCGAAVAMTSVVAA